MWMLTARPATLADAPWLLRLRNDPVTITGSTTPGTVALGDHLRWLKASLSDPARRLMVVMSDGVDVATYRLDGVGHEAVEVSLTVAPEARGRGFAVLVIRLAAEHAVREGADRVLAFVRSENMPSLRAFARAGFVESGAERRRYDWSPSGRVTLIQWEATPSLIAGWRCAACARGADHHTNSLTSIGRPGPRYPIYDMHEEGVGYGFVTYECDAGDLLLTWEQSRRRRMGETAPDYSVRVVILKEEGV